MSGRGEAFWSGEQSQTQELGAAEDGSCGKPQLPTGAKI